ncbi:MAG: hypothetical protein P4M14_09315 [Gammaproteobacteria bacterium]|nr:hypothetical protein [Gammaproteobacteria bacterium]
MVVHRGVIPVGFNDVGLREERSAQPTLIMLTSGFVENNDNGGLN